MTVITVDILKPEKSYKIQTVKIPDPKILTIDMFFKKPHFCQNTKSLLQFAENARFKSQ